MALLVDDIMTLLQSQSLGTLGVDIFAFMPDDPDAVPADTIVAVRETSGFAPELTLAGEAWENPRFQVLVRAPDFPAARQKAQEVYDVLTDVVAANMSASYYLSIEALQNPFPLGGPDSTGRSTVACNYQVTRVR